MKYQIYLISDYLFLYGSESGRGVQGEEGGLGSDSFDLLAILEVEGAFLS